MFILYAGGIHFNLSTGVNTLFKKHKHIINESVTPNFKIVKPASVSEKIAAYPTITLDLKLGYRFMIKNWFVDWNFLNLNLSPHFNLLKPQSLSASITMLRIGTIIKKWSIYGMIDPSCIQFIGYVDKIEPKYSSLRDTMSTLFHIRPEEFLPKNLGWGIALGIGASYQYFKYLSPNLELQYRIKLTGDFCQNILCLVGFEVHSSKYSQ